MAHFVVDFTEFCFNTILILMHLRASLSKIDGKNDHIKFCFYKIHVCTKSEIVRENKSKKNICKNKKLISRNFV